MVEVLALWALRPDSP